MNFHVFFTEVCVGACKSHSLISKWTHCLDFIHMWPSLEKPFKGNIPFTLILQNPPPFFSILLALGNCHQQKGGREDVPRRDISPPLHSAGLEEGLPAERREGWSPRKLPPAERKKETSQIFALFQSAGLRELPAAERREGRSLGKGDLSPPIMLASGSHRQQIGEREDLLGRKTSILRASGRCYQQKGGREDFRSSPPHHGPHEPWNGLAIWKVHEGSWLVIRYITNWDKFPFSQFIPIPKDDPVRKITPF